MQQLLATWQQFSNILLIKPLQEYPGELSSFLHSQREHCQQMVTTLMSQYVFFLYTSSSSYK